MGPGCSGALLWPMLGCLDGPQIGTLQVGITGRPVTLILLPTQDYLPL